MHSKQTVLNFSLRAGRIFRLAAASFILAAVSLPVLSLTAGSRLLSPLVLAAPAAPIDNGAANPANPNQPQPADPGQQGAPPLPPQTNDVSTCPKGQCIIDKYLNPAIKTVSALVGIGVTISIIIGGIQYASSADSPQKVSAAKTRIVKAIFILLAYFLFYAFLNWVIPGGIK